MGSIAEKLLDKLTEREKIKALRTLPEGKRGIDFSSNDYLGIALNPMVFEKAVNILLEKGLIINGATGSRLLTGNCILFKEVEILLGNIHQAESALIFNSGYDANIGLFSSVPQRDDIVLYDEFIHASIRDGITMGKARNYKFRHNDLKDLLSQIRRVQKNETTGSNSQIYIVTESVFSMDGDSPDLLGLSALCLSLIHISQGIVR